MKCSSFSSSEEQSLSDNSTLNVFESGCPDMAVSHDVFSAESADEYKRPGLEACVSDVEIKSPQRSKSFFIPFSILLCERVYISPFG